MTIDSAPEIAGDDLKPNPAEGLRQLTTATMTAGILRGIQILPTSDRGNRDTLGSGLMKRQVVIGPTSQKVSVGAGTALDHNGMSVELTAPCEVDLTALLTTLGENTAHLSLCQNLGAVTTPVRDDEPPPSAVHLCVPGDPAPRHGIPIATVRRGSEAGSFLISPIHAWAKTRGVLIGDEPGDGLTITHGTIVADGALRLIGRGQPELQRAPLDRQVIIGPRLDANLILGGDGIGAEARGSATDFHLQRSGGETHFGGPIRGPEHEPLTVLGGSDLSLGGGGVLMLGHQDGANLVLDENEITAREDGENAPLLLQWEGGETRLGGPLRGPADGPLNIIGGRDVSLGGNGTLMIGPEDAGHLVLDENEIRARTGDGRANLYLQWQGGETHFGGNICGPDNSPLTISGDQQATLDGGDGALMIGDAADSNLVFDDHQLMARQGENPADLVVQAAGGTTRFGGTVELESELAICHGGDAVAWFEPGAGWLSSSSHRRPGFEPEDLTDAAGLIAKLRPRRFRDSHDVTEPDRIADSDRTWSFIGFDGDEVKAVAPELVSERGQQIGVRHADLAALAIAALNEQAGRIEQLEQTVARLTAERDMSIGREFSTG